MNRLDEDFDNFLEKCDERAEEYNVVFSDEHRAVMSEMFAEVFEFHSAMLEDATKLLVNHREYGSIDAFIEDIRAFEEDYIQ